MARTPPTSIRRTFATAGFVALMAVGWSIATGGLDRSSFHIENATDEPVIVRFSAPGWSASWGYLVQPHQIGTGWSDEVGSVAGPFQVFDSACDVVAVAELPSGGGAFRLEAGGLTESSALWQESPCHTTPVALENRTSDRWFARSRKAWVLVLSASCPGATPRHHGGLPTHGAAESPCMPTTEPMVAVIIPALNEAGKIGRVLDKMPRDGRFEAIVVDDGSTDGTGDEARAHGAALVVRHEVRGGVGAAIRDGWPAGRRARAALPRPPLRRRPARARRAACARSTPARGREGRLRPGLALDAAAGASIGIHRRPRARDPPLLARLQHPRRSGGSPTPPTASGSSASTILDDPQIDLDQTWLTSYDLEPYLLYKAIRRGYRVIEMPGDRALPRPRGLHEDARAADWWRLFRPAAAAAARE